MSDRGATPYLLMALAVFCVSTGSILVESMTIAGE